MEAVMQNQSTPTVQQEQLKKLAALFLSEIIRSRKTSIARAAEISSLVTSALATLKTEDEVLLFLTQVEREFEEVGNLKQVLHFGLAESNITVYEKQIKEYAAELFKRDVAASSAFLEDAARPGCSVQELCVKYDEFCRFLTAQIPVPLNVASSR